MTLAFEEGSDSHAHGRDAKALARRMAALKAEAKDQGYFIVPLWEQAFRIGELLLMPAIAFALLTQGGLAAALGAMAAMLAAGLTEYNFGDSEFLMLLLVMITLPFAANRDGGLPS